MEKKIKMIDLFSGAGGLTKGFYENGFDPYISIEIDKWSVSTFNLNFNKKNKPIDILSSERISLLQKASKTKNQLLIGGFPCQGFSLAGKRNPDDPRNKLYKSVIEFIEFSNPKVFVLENVKGIISMSNGQDLKQIIEDLNSGELYTEYILLDSSNFGVPQKRERVIFIGSNKKNQLKVKRIIKLLKEHKENEKTVSDAISDLLTAKENYEFNHIFTKHTEEIKNKIIKLEEGKSLYGNYSDGWRKINWNKPSPTVKENHGGVHLHPIMNRALTPRELARLQSFPDDFIFMGPKSQQLKQIGNAVPVKLAFVIAKYVKDVFYE